MMNNLSQSGADHRLRRFNLMLAEEQDTWLDQKTAAMENASGLKVKRSELVRAGLAILQRCDFNLELMAQEVAELSGQWSIEDYVAASHSAFWRRYVLSLKTSSESDYTSTPGGPSDEKQPA